MPSTTLNVEQVDLEARAQNKLLYFEPQEFFPAVLFCGGKP
jgi:hypothetical protein